VILAAIAGLAAAAPALANPIVTFGYNNLSASYTGNTSGGTFAARAANTAGLRTAGDVTRNVTPEGTARFDAGFFGAGNSADFNISLNVSNITNPVPGVLFLADGNGTLTIADANGDTITATVSGFFIRDTTNANPNTTFFNGVLDAVAFNNVSGDGLFNGTDGGSWSLFGAGAYTGNVIELVTPNVAGYEFFNVPFEAQNSSINGEIVPTPGALALIGLGGLVAARRRRA
jgi:hypothetical protein